VRIRDRGYATFVNLNIPIFDWMKARSGMRQFQLRTEQVQANRAISERTFSRDYQNALARVKQVYEQIDLTRQQTKLAEEDLRLSRVRYEGGEGSALDVVTAQTQLAQARTNLYTTMANYLNARADLEVTAGR
jgi:outer membrane protein TolC